MIDLRKITTVAQCDVLLLAITDPTDIAALQAHRTALIQAQQQQTIYQHLCQKVGYSPALQKCIKDTVDQLLDKTISNGDEPGLLLGKIQCGKTRAFVGCMAMAFDRGIDVCIVMTKSDNGLVEQTKSRMEYEFRDYDPSLQKSTKIKVSLVENGKKFTTYEINNQKHIFVLHKNNARLNTLIQLFKKTEFSTKNVLIIDDEADYVSRTYYTKNNNITIGEIGKSIGNLIHTCSFCRYLEVTATPYSLFLQPDETIKLVNGTAEVFRPRFTTVVPIHGDYIGGKQYFYLSKNNASMYSYLKYDISQTCMDHLVIKNGQRIPYSTTLTTPVYADLRAALMTYVVGSAIRQLQEENMNRPSYQTSFFMHVATENKNHVVQEKIVNSILCGWSNCISQGNTATIVSLITQAYQDLYNSNQAGNKNQEICLAMPSLQDVIARVFDVFVQSQFAVQIVNTKNKPQIGKDGQLVLTNPLNIYIGGFKLDRGITISNMIGFFYGRNPNTMQADSVLQHHRMYGNRSKDDMSVTRLYTTPSIYANMEWIDNMDHELRNVFIKAMKNPSGGAPMTTISYNPQLGIQPCGRGKLKLSDLNSFTSFKRFSTFGFQTGPATKIIPLVTAIDNLLTGISGFNYGKPFPIDKANVKQIIKTIRDTYVYNRPVDQNAGMEWDTTEMIAAVEKYTPSDNMLWCYVVKDRNMSRVRQNGNFVDTPEDGNTDTPIAKQYAAQGRPVFLLMRQNGYKNDGWRDAPFYWPSLRLPDNIQPCIYCK